MSIKTDYMCDKCKGVFQNSNDLFSLVIHKKRGAGNYYADYSTSTVYPHVDWCEKCMKELGLVMEKAQEPKMAKVEKITMEDLVREIIAEQTGAC